MNGRDVVRLGLMSAPRRPIVTKHAHRTSGVPPSCAHAPRESSCVDLFSPLTMRRRVPIWNWLLTVVGCQAALGEKFLDVTIGERKSQIPSHRTGDHRGFEVAPFEQ